MRSIATILTLVLLCSACANDIPSPPGTKILPPGWIDTVKTPTKSVAKVTHDMLASSVVAAPKSNASAIATYEVHCPADAVLWVNGAQQSLTGSLRVFESDPNWKGEGRCTFRALIGGAYYEKEAPFKPGERQVINFNVMASRPASYQQTQYSTSGSCANGTCGR